MIISILCVGGIFAADTGTLYDGLFSRPSYFPNYTVPTTWPNNMTCYVQAIGTDGEKMVNYEVAVFDQNDALRAIGRSIASQGELCPLTILGTEGDVFHFVVVSGDFNYPDIQQTTETLSFKTNLAIPPYEPIQLAVNEEVLSMVQLNGAGYATYSAAYPLKVYSKGVGAYKAKVTDSNIVLSRLTGTIQAGTGLLLYGYEMADQYVYLQKCDTGVMADVNDNDLIPTTTATEPLAVMPTTGYTFALGNGSEFLRYTGVAFIPNRAYINLDYNPVASGGKSMKMIFDDEPDGIERPYAPRVSSGKFLIDGRIVIVNESRMYNIDGRRIAE